MAKRANRRPVGFDDLGLRRVLGDRMLPLLVAAMAFLAALALAGSVAAASLARHWQEGAAAALTVQVPRPVAPAAESGTASWRQWWRCFEYTREIASVRPLTEAELAALLRPWLGSSADQMALPLPGVVDVQLAGAGPDLTALATRLE